ncbi:hypothetical protein [Flavobacterium nitrogenifigens]|uniref:Uncharacterized protein n=1 Tax=Flavobacterium nitrogenifigens TaxID=1617283 RepID=A0A521ADU1_9FLAO|nr:hypothetical protein [Flavobacterium nitrogenifigens]KAF2331451.1 hypothetical protein DM397_11990 [Flavobacterium nitrogenifigens]SMO32985.1 hypothetical protein SAMN06265220_10145 [Flavobacterium nitrogenifigens]
MANQELKAKIIELENKLAALKYSKEEFGDVQDSEIQTVINEIKKYKRQLKLNNIFNYINRILNRKITK